MGLVVNDNNFAREVTQSELPVLVDFWRHNCQPCNMIAPIIEELSQEYQGRVKVVKANVSEAGKAAAALDIMAVPTLILFRSGKEVQRHMGFASKEQLIEKLLSKA